LFDGGNSPASWSAFAQGLLERLAPEAQQRIVTKPEDWPAAFSMSRSVPRLTW